MDGAASIARVAAHTGFSKETLRIWERRYGFPRPKRNRHGDRIYTRRDIEKLCLIRHLMNHGLRPGFLTSKGLAALQKTCRRLEPARAISKAKVPLIDGIVASLAVYDFKRVQSLLLRELKRRGLQDFVIHFLAPLNSAVGAAWADGTLSVSAEHLYSGQIEALLHAARPIRRLPMSAPTILLATPPGELHRLGLHMLEALLTQKGARCIWLGADVPLDAIARAVEHIGAQIVALSFSAAYPRRSVKAVLEALRRALPRQIEIWAGGEGAEVRPLKVPGLLAPMDLIAALARLGELIDAPAA